MPQRYEPDLRGFEGRTFAISSPSFSNGGKIDQSAFVDTRIAAIGTVASYCYESPKPAEFGGVGLNWEAIGWRVRVNFVSLLNKIRPKDHIDVLRRGFTIFVDQTGVTFLPGRLRQGAGRICAKFFCL